MLKDHSLAGNDSLLHRPITRAALAIMLVGATYIGVLSGLNTVVQMRAPEEARGRVLSLYMMALGTIYPLGLIVEGAIGQTIGVQEMTLLAGLILAGVLGMMAIFRRQIFAALSPAGEVGGLDVATPEVAEADLSGPRRSR